MALEIFHFQMHWHYFARGTCVRDAAIADCKKQEKELKHREISISIEKPLSLAISSSSNIFYPSREKYEEKRINLFHAKAGSLCVQLHKGIDFDSAIYFNIDFFVVSGKINFSCF